MVDGKLPFKLDMERGTQREMFLKVMVMKQNITAEELCKSKMASPLLPFVKTVLAMKFYEKPDYNYLKFLLAKVLLDNDVAPNHQYDWGSQNLENDSLLKYTSCRGDLNIVDEFKNSEMELSKIIVSYNFKDTKNRFY